MPGVALVGLNQAGGVQQGGGQSFCKAIGALVAVLGDTVASHGSGPHQGPKMAQGSSFFKIDGIPVCIAGNLATCGDATDGQAWFNCSE